MKTLRDLYRDHHGKVSDKWSLYLSEYDRLFSRYRDQSIAMLEIGVQNGGSLEIWSSYFHGASHIIGCDINPDCSRLTFEDPRIQVVIGDAGKLQIQEKILAYAPKFDIVIEDGSHHSADIIIDFMRYFPFINNDGLFVAEDLHCSYWQGYAGGLHDPYSSISFFKLLADVVNHERWGVHHARKSIFEGFKRRYGFSLDESSLAQVHSVEFINSMCVVRKCEQSQNNLGDRTIAGEVEAVVSGHLQLGSAAKEQHSQQLNFWSNLRASPAEQFSVAVQRDTTLGTELLSETLDEILHRRMRETEELKLAVAEITQSTSWKLTRPLRGIKILLMNLQRPIDSFKRILIRGGGFKNTFRKVINAYKRDGISGVKQGLELALRTLRISKANSYTPVYTAAVLQPASTKFCARVLVVGEFSIPQCKKYRITQKQEMFQRLGVGCQTLDWKDNIAVKQALQTHSLVIFYRVPGFPHVLDLIAEAKRLKITTYWDVDDVVFDREILTNSKTLAQLEKEAFDGLVTGAALYRNAMLACDKGLASTAGLADLMRAHGMQDITVIENALDNQTLTASEKTLKSRRPPNQEDTEIVRIVYGSGTNTHSVDFLEVASPLLEILSTHDNVRFRLIGLLDLPEEFADLSEKIERIRFCSYEEYLEHLATADINIAPLENYVFNDAKSNIKFLEASVVQLPSVCSPRSAFAAAIRHGETGFLCDNHEQWLDTLKLLVADASLRHSVGKQAYEYVMKHYHPDAIANQQLKCLLHTFNQSPKDANTMTVLSVNRYYAPDSFGGATIVAEEVNQLLNRRDDFEVCVFTGLSSNVTEPYSIKRYETNGINVFGVGLTDSTDQSKFDDPQVGDAFAEVIKLVRPDVVHIHSIQGIGISIINRCRDADIPYVITLHDAWWLCGRQFMINRQGHFCGQTVIDPKVCAACVDNPNVNQERMHSLRDALSGAAFLLTPSNYFAQLYIANGYAQRQVRINKNGIKRPKPVVKLRRDGPVRFGYVGGNTEIKGVHLVKEVFSSISGSQAELLVVDNTLNLGYTSFHRKSLKKLENARLVPAYTQHTIDQFFADIDVLLFPTQSKESFGLTVREALARNVWVITTDAGGAVEDILPGENGQIIPLDSKADILEQAVRQAIDRLNQYQPGQEIHLEHDHITFFEDQVQELADILCHLDQDSRGTNLHQATATRTTIPVNVAWPSKQTSD